MKKIVKYISAMLIAGLLGSILLVGSAAAGVTATPTKSTFLVNGSSISIEGYNINGNTYFKLRDLATVITGHGKNFAVDWDYKTGNIYLTSGRSYFHVGGELTFSGNTAAVTATPATMKVYLDGTEIFLTAYSINDYTYIKLRDIGAADDIGVIYNAEKNTISIDTSVDYYKTAFMNVLPDAYDKTGTGNFEYIITYGGVLEIDKYNDTHYKVWAYNLSSADDNAKLKSILSIFVTNADSVLSALDSIKYQGEKQLQLDGKTLTCIYDNLTQSIDIKW